MHGGPSSAHQRGPPTQTLILPEVGFPVAELFFDIVSPTPGEEVGRVVTITVTAGDTDPSHFPRFAVRRVSVSASGPSTVATKVGPSTWQATRRLRTTTAGGAPVLVTATASGDEIDQDPGGGVFTVPFSETREVQVLAEATAPEIGFDPFPHDVTVPAPPFTLTVTGTATDPATVASVQVSVDGSAVTTRNVSGDWAHWAADLSLGFGDHRIEARATDTVRNTGSRPETIIVRQPIEPEPVEQAFAMTNYLQEVVGMAARYLRVGGAAPTIDDLSGWLHQPLARLIEPVHFTAATASIARARIAVEVLRAVLTRAAPRSLDRRYRASAYEALLRELGASSEELRLARTADAPMRAALASRLGIALGGARPDRLDALTIAPDEITDRQLESLFGYRSTNPTDPMTILEPAMVSLWRQDALRTSWARADGAERDGADGPQPVIDPDLIVEAHLRSQDPADAARRLWTRRRSWIDDRIAEITGVIDGAAPGTAGFDAALRDAGLTIDLVDLAARDADGADITAELAALGLTLGAFRYLVRVRALAETGTVTASERRDVASILVQVRKRRVFRAWRREERQSGVVLSPDTFVADVDGDDQEDFTGVLRWRADGTVLARWRRTLATRQGQADASTAGHQGAIDAAERQVLTRLRDALITEIGRREDPPSPPQQTAERLSRQTGLDFRAAARLRTTRVGQAVDSLQTLLVSLRSGLLTRLGGKPVTVKGEANFDLEWEWLQTYARWRSAMEAFAYPENRLLPNLYLPEDVGTDRRLAPAILFAATSYSLDPDYSGGSSARSTC